MALILCGVISNLWVRPLMSLAYSVLSLLLSPLQALLL